MGPAGPQGQPGNNGSILVGVTPGTATNNDAIAGTTFSDTASCPPGSVLLGGGGRLSASDMAQIGKLSLFESYPSSHDTWTVTGTVVIGLSDEATAQAIAYAICSLPNVL